MKHHRTHRLAAALLLLLALLSAPFAGADAQRRAGSSQSSAARSSNQNARPRLVLLIVVDQFRYDYLERFGDLFVADGLRRLLRDGASWSNANYDHVPTYTAPGHATLMTGAWPAETGIIANEWPERATGRIVSNASDPEDTEAAGKYQLLGGTDAERGSSPRRLMASTLGDELRLATDGRSKVIGISVKDRAAILPTGRHANAAYWFGEQTGNMVSSSYYFAQLPAWVQAFNQARPADKFFGKPWERLLPEAEYLKRAGPDAPSWEKGDGVSPNTFPHTVTGGASAPGKDFYNALDATPFSNDLLLDFTRQAIINENLGADEDTDVLSLSFSANDYVGHYYGPYSQEVMDITLRTDRQIASLLDFVDGRIGLANTVVVFTADHGVAPPPEQSAALGLPGARIKTDVVLSAIRKAIRERYALPGEPDRTVDYIQTFSDRGKERAGLMNGNLYFNPEALKRDRVSPDDLERVAGDAALTVPGINRYFTRAQLQQQAVSPADPLARRILHGFYPTRSGDVILVYDAFAYLGDSITATHGSPYSYDTHVPLIIMAGGIKAGTYREAATPADIAGTLAGLIFVQPPSNATGRVLLEAQRIAVDEKRAAPQRRGK